MIAEGDDLAGGVHPAREIVEPGRAVEVVLDVVRAVPQQLDRRAYRLRDPGRLDHVIIAQPPSEAAADAGDVHLDSRLGHAERLGHKRPARARILRGRPDRGLAVQDRSRTILRLQRGVRQEGIEVGGFDHLGGAAERLVHVPGRLEALRRLIAGRTWSPVRRTQRCSARRWDLRPTRPSASPAPCSSATSCRRQWPRRREGRRDRSRPRR